MTKVILRKAVVSDRTGLSIRHLDRLATEGKFPPVVRLSSRACGFLESEVNEWLDERIAASRSDPSTANAPCPESFEAISQPSAKATDR